MRIYEIFGSKDIVKRHAPAIYHLPNEDDGQPRDWSVYAGKKRILSGKTRSEAHDSSKNPRLVQKWGKLHIAQEK